MLATHTEQLCGPSQQTSCSDGTMPSDLQSQNIKINLDVCQLAMTCNIQTSKLLSWGFPNFSTFFSFQRPNIKAMYKPCKSHVTLVCRLESHPHHNWRSTLWSWPDISLAHDDAPVAGHPWCHRVYLACRGGKKIQQVAWLVYVVCTKKNYVIKKQTT